MFIGFVSMFLHYPVEAAGLSHDNDLYATLLRWRPPSYPPELRGFRFVSFVVRVLSEGIAPTKCVRSVWRFFRLVRVLPRQPVVSPADPHPLICRL